MIEVEREIMFLPKKPRAIVHTSEFDDMKRALAEVTAKAAREAKDKPSLKRTEPDCPAPVLDEGAGESIEILCSQTL